MKKYQSLAIAIVMAASLAACSPQAPVPQMDQATGQPVPQAQHSDGYGAGTVAAAALGGAIVGNMVGKRSAQPQRTVIIDNRQPYYGSNNYNRGRTVTTTTTTKRGFGGKTITRTTTTKRR